MNGDLTQTVLYSSNKDFKTPPVSLRNENEEQIHVEIDSKKVDLKATMSIDAKSQRCTNEGANENLKHGENASEEICAAAASTSGDAQDTNDVRASLDDFGRSNSGDTPQKTNSSSSTSLRSSPFQTDFPRSLETLFVKRNKEQSPSVNNEYASSKGTNKKEAKSNGMGVNSEPSDDVNKQLQAATKRISSLDGELELLRQALTKKELERALAMEEAENLHEKIRKYALLLDTSRSQAEQAKLESRRQLVSAEEKIKKLTILLEKRNEEYNLSIKELEAARVRTNELVVALERKADIPENHCSREELEKACMDKDLAEQRLVQCEASIKALEAEALASRFDLEERLETSKIHLENERVRATESRSKYRAYVDTMARRTAEKFNEINEKVNAEKESALHSLRFEYDKKLADWKAKEEATTADYENTKQQLLAKIKYLESQCKEAEVIKEQNAMLTVKTKKGFRDEIEKQFGDAAESHRLRDRAKRETLKLAKQLEEQADKLQAYDDFVKATAIPVTQRLETKANDLSWGLESALSQARMPTSTEFKRSFLPNFGIIDYLWGGSVQSGHGFHSVPSSTPDSGIPIPPMIGQPKDDNKIDSSSLSTQSISDSNLIEKSGYIDELERRLAKLIGLLDDIEEKFEKYEAITKASGSSFFSIPQAIRQSFNRCFFNDQENENIQQVELSAL